MAQAVSVFKMAGSDHGRAPVTTRTAAPAAKLAVKKVVAARAAPAAAAAPAVRSVKVADKPAALPPAGAAAGKAVKAGADDGNSWEEF